MKRYIRSDSQKEVSKITIEFEFVVEVEYLYAEPVSASIRKSGDLHFISVDIINGNGNLTRVEREIDADFYSFVSAILSTAHSCGFVDMDVRKSPYSNSLYFTLCHESDFVNSVVEFIFYLRVSNHELPVRSKDSNVKDAKARKLKSDEQDSKQYNWTNSRYSDIEYTDADKTPFKVVDDYVEYEGTVYDYYNPIIDDVRKRLERLKRKYKPQPIPEPETESDEDSE